MLKKITKKNQKTKIKWKKFVVCFEWNIYVIQHFFYIEGTVILRVEGVVHCEVVCGFMIIYSFVYLLWRL